MRASRQPVLRADRAQITVADGRRLRRIAPGLQGRCGWWRASPRETSRHLLKAARGTGGRGGLLRWILSAEKTAPVADGRAVIDKQQARLRRNFGGNGRESHRRCRSCVRAARRGRPEHRRRARGPQSAGSGTDQRRERSRSAAAASALEPPPMPDAIRQRLAQHQLPRLALARLRLSGRRLSERDCRGPHQDPRRRGR